jgi:ABC-2 type transport system permease protein
MSTVDVGAAAARERPRTLVSLAALLRLVLRTQISVRRLLGISALSAVAVLLGLFARSDADSSRAAADVVSGYGLGILVPLAALWLGTSALGDLVEDRLLVYLSLKPVPRWQLPAAAVLATAIVVVPLTALPLVASTLVAGAADVAWATLAAASLGALAYSGLFVAAGLWFRRAAWWGLAFVLLWENAAAYSAEGTARFTVAGWASAVLALAPDVDVQLDAGSAGVACGVLLAVTVVAWLATTWRYGRADID